MTAGEATDMELPGNRRAMSRQRIAARRQPDRFKLVRAWRTDAVRRPGNLVCCTDDDADCRIVALDGGRAVVELDPEGAEVARHTLDLPPDATVCFLRTAVDAAGSRWWLLGSHGGRQVFVYDAAWKLHASHPVGHVDTPAVIKTAQLVDLDADGMPEIVVAFQGDVGMKAVKLDGRRVVHEHRGMVLDVVPDAPRDDRRRGLVCVDGQGKVVALETGMQQHLPGVPQPEWANTAPVASLFAGPVAPDGAWAFLGLTAFGERGNRAMGLGPLPEHCWDMELPEGVFENGAFEPVAWADLLGTPRRQWLIAAPDGSIVVAWADGRVVDRYRHGEPLVGIGGYRHANEGVIVVATPDAVAAYRVDDVALD